MSSLRLITNTHAPLLVIDAASGRVHVGWIEGSDCVGRWVTSEEESGVAVFRGIERLEIDVAEAGAFVFCDGPGSILGIRTVAMALRAWTALKARPVFAYRSLSLVAHSLPEREAMVIADARRDSWHTYRIGEGLRRLPGASLTGDIVMPEGFRHWSTIPPQVRLTPYSVGALLTATADVDLLVPAAHPDAFLHEEPSYATWTPHVHRAP